MFLAHLKQKKAGCGCGVGCGEKLMALEARTLTEANEEISGLLKDVYAPDGDTPLEKITLYAAVDPIQFEAARLYTKTLETALKRRIAAVEANEKEIYERLRKKYGGK